jgi:hypothetical protein
MTPATLVVFARYPRPGEVKTRLAPRLGLDGAAALARRMLVATWAEALAAARSAGCRLELHGCGADGAGFSALLGDDVAFFAQSGEGFGERLERAFASALERGGGRVVLVGADCPVLSARHFDEALAALESNDAVLGPARDGGWWLLGLRAPAAALFHDIAWSTPIVFEQTLAAARASGLSVALLEELADIDTPADLERLGPADGRWKRPRSNTAPGQLPSPPSPRILFGQASRRRVGGGEQMTPDIDTIVQRIVEAFSPRRVVLFGSRARGDGDVESDVDLMVEMESDESPPARAIRVSGLFPKRRFSLDVLVYTPAEVTDLRGRRGSMLEIIDREGKVLHERS